MSDRQQTVAIKMSALISEKEVAKVFQKVIENMMEYLGATSGSIFLIDGSTVSHHMLAAAGTFPQVAQYKMSQVMEKGLAGWAYNHKQGALASDTHIDTRWVKLGDEEKFGSAVAIPLKSASEIIGMMILQHETRGFFNEQALADAVFAAQFAVPIIEHAKSIEAEQRRTREVITYFGASDVATIIMEAEWIKSANGSARKLFSMESKESATSNISIGAELDDMYSNYGKGDDGGKSRMVEVNGSTFKAEMQHMSGIGLLVQFHAK